MLDEYVWGDVERISPEAPIPVLRVSRRETRAGGAGSVVVNLARLGARVEVFSLLGRDDPGRKVAEIFRRENCEIDGLLHVDQRPTTVKTRLLGFVQQAHRAVQQIARVDQESRTPIKGEAVSKIVERLRQRARHLDAVLISDYQKGLVTAELLRNILAAIGEIPVLVDPARLDDYSRYQGAYLLCPNRFETELATGLPCRDLESCRRAGQRLVELLGLRATAITLDREGIFLYEASGRARHFPTQARVVADVTGAGDMVLSVLGLVCAAGGSFDEAVELANVAAGLEVRHVGVTPVSREQLLQELTYRGLPVVGKIKNLEELKQIVRDARDVRKTIVFTNGCFDCLHPGHQQLLNGARGEGDMLIVAVNSDPSVRQLKGRERPVWTQEERVEMLSALEVVDYVIVFDEDEPNQLLEELRPDVLVKGSEYRDGVVVGREIVEGYGGRVAFVEQLPGISTTLLLERCRDAAPASRGKGAER